MKVLLVDDHPLILSALQTVIEGLDREVEVVGVESAAQAREALGGTPGFQLALLDLQLGDADGFELMAEMRAAHPELPVVVVSASDRTSDVIRAIDQGAMGFIPKRSSTEALAQALKLVMAGGIYVPSMNLGGDAVPAGDADGRLRQIREHAMAPGYQQPELLQDLALTPRQNEVLALLLQGKPNKIIARELGVTVDTIKDHVAAVLKALGVSSRTQAVLAVGQMARAPSR
ncbi:response regulator transcription factor [Pelomonas sp. KK5]|uniref:response regulator n=1 Tax=Pelomonas sp. KK5 TaxID=1855730 RepID=UPI00097C0A6F|nr:response regulator transcription factor [Pelomonas sp. KK5]